MKWNEFEIKLNWTGKELGMNWKWTRTDLERPCSLEWTGNEPEMNWNEFERNEVKMNSNWTGNELETRNELEMNFNCLNNKIFMSFIVFILFLYGFGERVNNICGITPGYVITATENHIKLYQIILFKYFPQSPSQKIFVCVGCLNVY